MLSSDVGEGTLWITAVGTVFNYTAIRAIDN